MSKRNDGGSAFPISNGGSIGALPPGMSLRDYFAAQALPDAIGRFGTLNKNSATLAAKDAYLLADAMLAERAKP